MSNVFSVTHLEFLVLTYKASLLIMSAADFKGNMGNMETVASVLPLNYTVIQTAVLGRDLIDICPP